MSEPFRAPSWTYIKEQVAEFAGQTKYGRREFIVHFDKAYKEKILRDWARMVQAVTDVGADIDDPNCHVHTFQPTLGGSNDYVAVRSFPCIVRFCCVLYYCVEISLFVLFQWSRRPKQS